MFKNNKKAQTSIEILMILGVLVIGGIILGVFYLSMSNDRINQATDLSNVDYSSWLDDNSSTNITSTITCGNGTIETGEECDLGNLNGLDCTDFGYVSGTLGCFSNCLFDKSNCSYGSGGGSAVCGNGTIEPPEQCDGDTGEDCASFIPGSTGTISCYPPFTANECMYDTTGCIIGGNSPCGDGVCDPLFECSTCPVDCYQNHILDPACATGSSNILNLVITPSTGSTYVNQGFTIDANTEDSTSSIKYTLKVNFDKWNGFDYVETSNCRYNNGVRTNSITLGSNLSPDLISYTPFDCNTDGTYRLSFTVTEDTNLNNSVSEDTIWTITPSSVVPTPMATPSGSMFPNSPVSVALSCEGTRSGSVEIRYTTDNSEPTQSSSLYSTPISLTLPKVLKAKAFAVGKTPSAVMTESYFGKVATPEVYPRNDNDGKPYHNGFLVSLLSDTSGSTIYYTTDGSDPLPSSSIFNGTPFPINANLTLKASALRVGFYPSDLMAEYYTFKVGLVTSNYPAGTYSESISLTLDSITNDANIYYTTNGTDPNTSGVLYNGTPILISTTTTLKAIGKKTGYTNSNPISLDYVIDSTQVAAPTITPIGTTLFNSQNLTLNTTTSGATICYSVDGSAPTNPGSCGTSLVIDGTIDNPSPTVAAKAFKSGMIDSEITFENYDFEVSIPVANPAHGSSYTAPRNITLSTITNGDVIRYTSDGTEPTLTNGFNYMYPIPVLFNTTIKAKAYKDGYSDSALMSEFYEFITATPTSNPPAGLYSSEQSITLSSTNGDIIYYTLDGSTPTTSSPIYGGPFIINSNKTLKAIAVKTGWSPSSVMTAEYLNKSYCNDIANVAFYRGTTPANTQFAFDKNVTISTLYGPDEDCTGNFSNPSNIRFNYPRIDNKLIVERYTGDTNSAELFCLYHGGVYSNESDFEATTNDAIFGSYLILQGNVLSSSQLWGEYYPNLGAQFNYYHYIECDFTPQLTDTVIPSANNPGGTYTNLLTSSVVLSSTTPGAEIYYTTNGADPVQGITASNSKYTSPITISNSGTTLKARAFATGYNPSDIATHTYYYKSATPTASVDSGLFVSGSQVILSTTTTGAEIYYTTDGTEPTTLKTKYTGPITLNQALGITITLKAKAFRTGFTSSVTMTKDYVMALITPTPAPTIAAGTYSVPQNLKFTNTNVYYTINGDEPVGYSTPTNFRYTNMGSLADVSIPINSTTTIKAKGFLPGFVPSTTFTGTYTINPIYTAKDIDCSESSTFAVVESTSKKLASGWGNNYYGQIIGGINTRVNMPRLIPEALLSGVTQISSGYMHTCALLSDKTVKCWGENESGQLGNGTTSDTNIPTIVSGLSNVTQIITGGSYYEGGYTCALLTDKTVKCWGANNLGQLGNGTTVNKLTPVAVTGLSDVVELSRGYNNNFTCARLFTGAIKCWGENGYGQLGDGSRVDRSIPVSVLDVSNATMIETGGNHTCAIVTNGVKCWGKNFNGQLGDGTNNNYRLSPVLVSGLSNVSSISLGYMHTCALLSDKSVKCWGSNWTNELGDGTDIDRLTPVNVSNINVGSVNKICSGEFHNCALLTSGAIKCWGSNGFGQIGNGSGVNADYADFVRGFP